MSGLQNRLNESCRRCVLAPGTQLAPGEERGETVPLITQIHPIYIGFHGSRTNGMAVAAQNAPIQFRGESQK